jgi:hypothetical protein
MDPIPEMLIDIKIGEERFTRNLNNDLSIDAHNLDDSLINQAALYGYYAIRLQQATELRDNAEFEYEKTLNESMQVVREELMSSDKGKVTDSIIKAVVNTQDAVLARKKVYLNRAANRDKLYSLTRALEQKLDALKSLAFKQRSELDAITSSSIYKKRAKVPISGVEDDE